MLEATRYYRGLASYPRLIFRTGTTPWNAVTAPGPGEFPERKELKPVFDHKIITAWKTLGPKLIACLDSVLVMWTSIDGVRFSVNKYNPPGPVVLWIGVMPQSLSGEDANDATCGCLALLLEFCISDVDVEFRESIYTPALDPHTTGDSCSSVDINAASTPDIIPYFTGNRGLYICDRGTSHRIFLVTARQFIPPPAHVTVGVALYDEDYAVIEIDSSAIDKRIFRGNVMELGEMTLSERIHKLHRADFEYIGDHLFKLNDIIPEDQLHSQDVYKYYGCHSVIKNGGATGVTVGRATGMPSAVREYLPDGTTRTSMAWAILRYDDRSGEFAAPGDAGAVIADGHGHVGGILTGGAGTPDCYDIVYATPVARLFERMRNGQFPDAHINPVLV